MDIREICIDILFVRISFMCDVVLFGVSPSPVNGTRNPVPHFSLGRRERVVNKINAFIYCIVYGKDVLSLESIW